MDFSVFVSDLKILNLLLWDSAVCSFAPCLLSFPPPRDAISPSSRHLHAGKMRLSGEKHIAYDEGKSKVQTFLKTKAGSPMEKSRNISGILIPAVHKLMSSGGSQMYSRESTDQVRLFFKEINLVSKCYDSVHHCLFIVMHFRKALLVLICLYNIVRKGGEGEGFAFCGHFPSMICLSFCPL